MEAARARGGVADDSTGTLLRATASGSTGSAEGLQDVLACIGTALYVVDAETQEYAAFSPKHLLDIANLTMLVYPGLIALAALSCLSPRGNGDDQLGLFFAWRWNDAGNIHEIAIGHGFFDTAAFCILIYS